MANEAGSTRGRQGPRSFLWPALLVVSTGCLLYFTIGSERWWLVVWCLASVMILLPRFQVLPIEAPAERLEAENKTRQTLAQVIGGLMLLGGAFVGWKQFENQRAQLTEQRRQFEVQTGLQRNQTEEQRRQYES